MRLLLLRVGGVGQHVTKGLLVDDPERAGRFRDTGGTARTVVEQGEFSERSPAAARAHLAAVHFEANGSVVHHVEVVPRFSLRDNGNARFDLLRLHGVDQQAALATGQIGKDEIVAQGAVDELDGFFRFRVEGRLVVLLHVQLLREDILTLRAAGAFLLLLVAGLLGRLVVLDLLFLFEEIHLGEYVCLGCLGCLGLLLVEGAAVLDLRLGCCSCCDCRWCDLCCCCY